MTLSFELNGVLEEFLQDVRDRNDDSSSTTPLAQTCTPDRFIRLKQKFCGNFADMMNWFGQKYADLSSLVVARKFFADESNLKLAQAKKRLDALKKTMDWCMESEFGDEKSTQKLRLPSATISYRQSVGLVIDDASVIPEHFKKKETVVTVLNADVKDALQSGVLVEGARLDVRKNIQIK